MESFKLPGVQIRWDLTYDNHIAYIINKDQPQIHDVRVAKQASVPPDTLFHIYFTFIQPQGWYPKTLWKNLKLFREGVVDVLGKHMLSSLPSLEERRLEATKN